MSQEILNLVEQKSLKGEIPTFNIGDTVDVHTRILEGEKERIQIFNGVVIARAGSGTRETFTLQGNVQFTAAAELLDLFAESDFDGPAHVDISRVFSFTDVARRMTLEGLRRLRNDGRRVFLHDPLQSLADPDLGDGTYPETP